MSTRRLIAVLFILLPLTACARRPAKVSADVLRQALASSSSSSSSEEFVPKLVMPKSTTPRTKQWILRVPQKEEKK